jgi:hypothetical protein
MKKYPRRGNIVRPARNASRRRPVSVQDMTFSRKPVSERKGQAWQGFSPRSQCFLVLGAAWTLATPPAEAVRWIDEDFSDGLVASWLALNAGSGDNDWRSDLTLVLPGLTQPYMAIDPWLASARDLTYNDTLLTPALDFCGAEQVIVTFDHYQWQSSTDTFQVAAQTPGGFLRLAEYTDAVGGSLRNER